MTTKTGIIYLQKDRFHLYSPYLPNVLEFRFVPELISDFDLVNREMLENLLKVFIANNKIPASGMEIIVADSASFIKDFVSPPVNPAQPTTTPPPTLEDLQNFANQYIEQVPFDEVAGKTFPLATGVRAYATNQEVYEAIKSSLEKIGFIIEGVFPGFAFGPDVSAKPALDGPAIGIIMQKLGAVRQYNLLKQAPTVVETPKEEEVDEKEISSSPEKKNKIVLIVAIAVIAAIFIGTGLVLYSQFTASPYAPAPTEGDAAQSQPTSAVAQPPQTVVSPTVAAAIEVSTLNVQITTVSSSASTAEQIRAALSPYKFQSISTKTQDTVGAQTLLIFSPDVTPDVRTAVTSEIKKVLGDILVQEKTDTAADIVIILGK